MSGCRILLHAVPAITYGHHSGVMRAVAHCEVHGIELEVGQLKCAIGLINDATNDALAKIKEAAEQR